MVEAGNFLEMFACTQAAISRNEKSIKDMKEAYDQYRMRIESDLLGVNEDFNSHLEITEASQNIVIKTLMLIILPDIITIYQKLNMRRWAFLQIA